mmetsp:Transcript_1249/g.2748  ORF Transcript_1249/g.2748 Transcript_1249/m.2748 type:complete len:441 (-) Transcript_1249:68-1390(-)|eukprot:CAMPEP_0172458666 /NCGR_PEP_ID=MMETSP1065-20121228/28629_1 /TAXON_ID=265537 /ORGANISM="Amphiprora paludosa, Strain CCMP125" /LENGTH=440 /DNA_ID=CAMNT_0013213025 /DNA_START=143 /DNA_END=1465 /DNA_ORIENTATION=+
MSAIKRDVVKQSWEDTEFPLVCETCLGDNPYVRMTKEPHGKKCQICETPFTVFAWQAGTKGRIKRVEICRSCAQAKNVCQVCIYDLQYGLPVKVRDKVLREAGASGAGSAMTAVPQSQANRSWFTAQQQRALDQGQNLVAGSGTDEASIAAHAKLSEMARMEPRYERNLAKLCSFFAQGECNRGANCPFRHEMPRDRNDPMAKQSTKDRFYGTSDPVANKILGRRRRFEDKQQAKEDDDFEKARATLYMRLRGDAPYPPFDEMDVRDMFYAYGEIVSVRVQSEKGQAFVEYTTPEATELAVSTLNTNKQQLKDRPLLVAWARAPKRGESEDGSLVGSNRGGGGHGGFKSSAGAVNPAIRPLAPPGGAAGAKKIPKLAVKPPPEVSAAAAARRQRSGISTSVPRPGGGPIRGAGTKSKPHHPYYPSANPNRLGTKGAESST